jgi:hypothetical protein
MEWAEWAVASHRLRHARELLLSLLVPFSLQYAQQPGAYPIYTHTLPRAQKVQGASVDGSISPAPATHRRDFTTAAAWPC